MSGHRTTVDFGTRTRCAHALGNVEDDAREAILIDPDFLVVWDLTQLTDVGELLGKVADDGAAKERRTEKLRHRGEANVQGWMIVLDGG